MKTPKEPLSSSESLRSQELALENILDIAASYPRYRRPAASRAMPHALVTADGRQRSATPIGPRQIRKLPLHNARSVILDESQVHLCASSLGLQALLLGVRIWAVDTISGPAFRVYHREDTTIWSLRDVMDWDRLKPAHQLAMAREVGRFFGGPSVNIWYVIDGIDPIKLHYDNPDNVLGSNGHPDEDQ